MHDKFESINIGKYVADISDDYELCNNELKKEYMRFNIEIINAVMRSIKGYAGSFGTGYPFYVLKENFEGELPIIEEQIRYNNELRECSDKSNRSCWYCYDCLHNIGSIMPDLKQWCKPCPYMDDGLKPRKIINRLPDMDMWMIVEDDKYEEAKTKLLDRFNKLGLYTSDVDPIRSIKELDEVVSDLKNGNMPRKYLPLDVHIVKKSELILAMDRTYKAFLYNIQNPYVPMLPLSLRKTWQHDDTAYNFAFDFLFSLTPFNWDEDIMKELTLIRREISNKSDVELESILLNISGDSVKRRFETEELKLVFKERTNSWKR